MDDAVTELHSESVKFSDDAADSKLSICVPGVRKYFIYDPTIQASLETEFGDSTQEINEQYGVAERETSTATRTITTFFYIVLIISTLMIL